MPDLTITVQQQDDGRVAVGFEHDGQVYGRSYQPTGDVETDQKNVSMLAEAGIRTAILLDIDFADVVIDAQRPWPEMQVYLDERVPPRVAEIKDGHRLATELDAQEASAMDTQYEQITAEQARRRRLVGEIRTDPDGVRRAYDAQSQTFWVIEDLPEPTQPTVEP